MQNPFTNRMTVNLGGLDREIVANFEALSSIQSALNGGELQVIRRFGTGNFGIKEVATIIYYGLKANGDNRFTLEQVGNAILESKKYDEYAAKCVEFLSLGLNTGEESEGKGEPEAEKAPA